MGGIRIDEELVRRLAALLEETGLAELEIAEGRRRIRASRVAAARAPAAAPAPSPTPMSAPTGAPDGDAGADGDGDADSFASHPGAVTSPMVGTLYVAPSQGADPFVRTGDKVKEGDQLFIVEAMKTMNPIAAHRAGTVTRLFVPDGTPVEYGSVLALIE